MMERGHIAPARADQAEFNAAIPGLLQRRCACGNTSGIDGECAGCRGMKLRRSVGWPSTGSRTSSDLLRQMAPSANAAGSTSRFARSMFADDFRPASPLNGTGQSPSTISRPTNLSGGNSSADAGPSTIVSVPADQQPGPSAPTPEDIGGLAPTCAHPGRSRTVNLQPVFLKTSDADTAPTGASWDRRYALTAAIWSKLGVSFGARDPVTIVTPLKTAGSDNSEANQVAALRNTADVEVFLVDNEMSWTGGAITYPIGGGAASQTVMSDRGTSNTLLAHEQGHTLGLGHPPTDADANTVMVATGSNSTANPTRNTMNNYNRITWPAPSGSTCLSPDP